MKLQSVLGLLVFVLFFSPLNASSGDTIALQLKWRHQFQFAGYYAAQLKGFYRQEGLHVKLLESGPGQDPVAKVLNGTAEFGVSGSDLVLNYIHHEPVVALAAVFQHSPYIVLSEKSKHINSPVDLVGKTIMASNTQGWVQVEAMLLKEGIPRNSVHVIDHSWNVDDLVNGKTDAQTAYSSVEPNLLREKGYQPSVLMPENYGIDFYGDVLFTSKQEISQYPETVEKFRRASMRGWEYAMQHPEELVDYILTLPGVKERGITREQLLNEAEEMQKLILSGTVEVGHMNEGRWQHILDTYKLLNLAPVSASLDGFIYNSLEAKHKKFVQLVMYISVAALLLILFGISYLYSLRRARLETQLRLKTSEEHLELAVNGAGLGIWDWNMSANTLFLNNTWKTMLGYAPSEIEDNIESFYTLLHPDDVQHYNKSQEEHIAGISDSMKEVFRLKTKSGKWKWVLSQGQAKERDADGKAIHIAGIHLDMDELKKKEQELHRITDELMMMNTELQQFAFVTSHNLRAPVASIMSLLNMLDPETLSETNKDIRDKMKFSAEMLMNTLKDLNEILTAKKETEKPKEQIVIRERFYNLLVLFSKELEETNTKLEADFSGAESVYFPVTIFDSILTNLLSNAVKFRNRKRPLHIYVSSGEDNEYIFLKFRDNGSGVDLEVQGHKIFRLYQRFHENTEGKGMGLYIIKTQLESLKGKITVTSVPGEGTEFTVWIRKQNP